MKNSKIQIFFFFFSIIITFSFGFFSGIFFEELKEVEARKEIEITEGLQDKIPLVHFEKIENGVMYGKTGEKEIRFIIGENEKDIEVFTSHGGKFEFSVIEILPMLKKIPAPENAKFVASERGSKFYPLDMPNAFLISAKNRIFFESEEEAIKEGYERFQD